MYTYNKLYEMFYYNFSTWIINIRNAIENVNAEIGENWVWNYQFIPGYFLLMEFSLFLEIYQYVWLEAAIEQFLGQLEHPSVFHYRLNSFILLTQQMGDERHGTMAWRHWQCCGNTGEEIIFYLSYFTKKVEEGKKLQQKWD